MRAESWGEITSLSINMAALGSHTGHGWCKRRRRKRRRKKEEGKRKKGKGRSHTQKTPQNTGIEFCGQ